MNLNKVYLVGRVTKDPEQRALPSGSTITTFSLATNHVFKKQNGEKVENTSFHNCTVFGKQAETFATYVVKGQEIMVEGRIDYQSWDKKDGTKGYRTQIIVERFQFGQKPNNAGSSAGVSTATKRMDPVDPADILVIEEPGEIDVSQIDFE